MTSKAVVQAKNWLFNVNQKMVNTGVVLTDYRQLMLAMVNSMLGFAGNPWTCVGSSNSVTSNLTGTNLWAGNTSLVWATTNGTAHSWIVLKNVGGTGTFQLLISLLGGTNGFQGRIAFSAGGNYTGGSATTDPTATDEVVALAGNWTDSTFQTNVVGWISLHAEMSVDGQCTRIWHSTQQGNVNGCLFIETLLNVPSAFSPAVAVLALGNSVHLFSFSNLVTSSFLWAARVNGVSATARLVLAGSNTPFPNDSTNAGNFENDLDEGFPVCPAGMMSATAGARGMLGVMQDMALVTTQLRLGQHLNVGKTAVGLNPLVLPFNGTDLLIGG